MKIIDLERYLDVWILKQDLSNDMAISAKNILLNFFNDNPNYLSIEILFRQNNEFSTIYTNYFNKYKNNTTRRVYFNKCVDFLLWLYGDMNLDSTKYKPYIKKIGDSIRMSNKGKGQRSDPHFLWALKYDTQLITWQEFFKEFLSLKNRSYNLYRQAFNNFLDYLIDVDKITREPREYVNIDYKIHYLFYDYLINEKDMNPKNSGLSHNISKIFDFFEWFLLTNCMDNNALLKHGYTNPIKKIPRKNTQSSETFRNSLPTRYLNMLENIIMENDFEWPKTIKNDWQKINNINVWNPVVSYLILLKLKLPLRTYQIRHLDSGEGDGSCFNFDKWKWEKNKKPIYVTESKYIKKGVLRKIIDRKTSKEFVGFYINTNKTNDINKEDKGYVIPWENKEAIKLISDLLKWQKAYNPIQKTLAWKDINDVNLKKKSDESLDDLGESIFLFRDVYNKDPAQPVLDSRIQFFWRKLLAELEKRVNVQRELAGEEHLEFIKTWNVNTPMVTLYDLHSLRVTILTGLYQSGVPYTILSKYIAGHSSIVMTMYYTKFNFTHISEVLNQATKDIELNEQKNFSEYLANKQYDELENNIVFNDSIALNTLEQVTRSNYISSDIGICPVGENKCNEGGELITGKGNNSLHKAVNNGIKNCIRCRFFITGVPFLIGLTTKFNELAIMIKEKTKIFKNSEEEYESLYAQRYHAEKNQKEFLKWKELEIADSTYNRHNNDLNELIIDWHHLYNFIEQCLILKEEKNSQNKFSLIAHDNINEMNININECSEFELYDTVCQSSNFYKSIEPNIANLKRGKIISSMLMNNDIKPYFILMDEKESLEVGNEFVKLLMLKLGKPNAIDVITNKKRLVDFGLSIDIKEDIEQLLKNKYTYDRKLIARD